MAKLDRSALRELREGLKEKAAAEKKAPRTRIIVGMGTCGIAAGAKEAWEVIRRAVAEFGLDAEVEMRQTGCMGLCHVEPTVEIAVPGMPAVIYGKVTAEVAGRLVRKHVVEKTLLDGHILDRPAVDIAAGGLVARGGK